MQGLGFQGSGFWAQSSSINSPAAAIQRLYPMPSPDPGPQHDNLGAESPSHCSQFNLRATATIRRSRCQALPTSKIQRRRSFEGGNRLIGLRRLLLTSIHDMYGTTHEGASSHLRGMPAKVLTLLAVARDGVEERHVCGGQLKRWRFQVCSEVLPIGRAQDRRAAMLQHPREQHLRW